MPIKTDNYVQFFQGACAESHIAALFQFAGYEVNKVTPDAGIDLIVTNIARCKFRNEAPKSICIQVKSTMTSEKRARFWLSSEEMDFLCSGVDRYTVFAIFHDLKENLDTDHFDIYADQVQRMIDLDAERFMKDKNRALHGGNHRRPSILDFTNYSLTLFWLNSNQMELAKKEGIWVHDSTLEKWRLQTTLNDGGLYIGDSMLLPALQEVRYMMVPCLSHDNFIRGKFSFDHI